MKRLVLLLALVFLASACATGEMITKPNLVELGKSLGPEQTLIYTRITEVETLEIKNNAKKPIFKKKPGRKKKYQPIMTERR